MKVKKRTFHANGWEGQKGWEFILTENEALALYSQSEWHYLNRIITAWGMS